MILGEKSELQKEGIFCKIQIKFFSSKVLKYICIVQFLLLDWVKVNWMILLRAKITMALLFLELLLTKQS